MLAAEVNDLITGLEQVAGRFVSGLNARFDVLGRVPGELEDLGATLAAQSTYALLIGVLCALSGASSAAGQWRAARNPCQFHSGKLRLWELLRWTPLHFRRRLLREKQQRIYSSQLSIVISIGILTPYE